MLKPWYLMITPKMSVKQQENGAWAKYSKATFFFFFAKLSEKVPKP